MSERTELRRLARRFGLRLVSCGELTIRRVPRGRGFSYLDADGAVLKDAETLARFRSLAVPPAYRNVRLAPDPQAHLQAVGEDAAGRLQYRYHPDWTQAREAMKAQRLAALAGALVSIGQAVRRALRRPDPDRQLALAAVVRLVELTAIRAGGEQYAEENGTRGATTLLKSHVRVEGKEIALAFKGKGGKMIRKSARDARLAEALTLLRTLPGSRLFKYRDAEGRIHPVRTNEVNDFLKAISGQRISLKDFRTLTASLGVLDQLGRVTPETSERGRRRQIREAVAPLAEQLANTLSVCRTSYVHDSVIAAFESGKLGIGAASVRSSAGRAQMLTRLLHSRHCGAGRCAAPRH
ncbi:DNA topoisomerase IB [Ancylobacter sp. MQZ15Z-1]|uniref:DNA topoisomerase IB n=1 Tax=Ancylobacter mangrovi TaxID=2972472 RepID=A0A9X2T5K8_9HYPH|nr:DNA topoisomerase IB [Ancylobacter mangrovi]MCS0494003.1 DNA topoisomerase IB [Ancylobacter mangrovi]